MARGVGISRGVRRRVGQGGHRELDILRPFAWEGIWTDGYMCLGTFRAFDWWIHEYV